MATESLLNRYELAARAAGLSPNTIKHTKRVVGFFDTFLGGINDVRKVEADDLRQFTVALQERTAWQGLPQGKGKKLSGTAINTYVRAVKAFWGWLQREGITKENPLADVPAPKLPKRLPKTFTEAELEAVFRAIGNDRDRALVALFLDSGMRLKELTELDVDNLDLKSGQVRVIGKGDKERVVFFNPTTAVFLDRYINGSRPEPKGEDRVFLTKDGYPLRKSSIQTLLARIGKRASLGKRLSPHKLRHSYATLSLRHGANLEYLRRLMGHTDIKTTQVYLTVADSDMSQAHRSFSPVGNLKTTTSHPLPPWRAGVRHSWELAEHQPPGQQKRQEKLKEQLRRGEEPEVVTFQDIDRARRALVEER